MNRPVERCPHCGQMLRLKTKVLNYIRKHPNCTIEQIVSATSSTTGAVEQMIHQLRTDDGINIVGAGTRPQEYSVKELAE